MQNGEENTEKTENAIKEALSCISDSSGRSAGCIMSAEGKASESEIIAKEVVNLLIDDLSTWKYESSTPCDSKSNREAEECVPLESDNTVTNVIKSK